MSLTKITLQRPIPCMDAADLLMPPGVVVTHRGRWCVDDHYFEGVTLLVPHDVASCEVSCTSGAWALTYVVRQQAFTPQCWPFLTC